MTDTPSDGDLEVGAEVHTWYALDRMVDLSGVSGTGRVAYALVLEHGVIIVWDTTFVDPQTGEEKHSQGVEWLPSLALLDRIHCYGGKTRLTRLDSPRAEDWAGVLRAEQLLRAALPRLAAVCAELNEEIP